MKLERRSRAMSGSATFTIVMSSSSMNVATHTAPSVHQRRSSWRGVGGGGLAPPLRGGGGRLVTPPGGGARNAFTGGAPPGLPQVAKSAPGTGRGGGGG